MLDTVKANPANILSDHKTLLETMLAKIQSPFTKNKLINPEVDPVHTHKSQAL